MTGGNLRQRRGKQQASGKNATMKEDESSAGSELDPIDQLRNAQQKLMMSHQRTVDLHTAWRAQMFRISLLIIFVTMHQFQSPISTCIADTKESNEAAGESGEETIISGLKAVMLIFTESFCELLGVIIASLLSYFLALSKDSPLELDAWPYVASSAFVPPLLGFYFHSKKLGCLGTGMDESSPTRQFPVVVIYHTVVTFAFWFMKNGIQQCEDHVNLVNESIKDFQRMDKKIKQKQQLREKAAKKRHKP
mmetsp:Transcript_31567/g.63755  ORF Transcript_31567/g.63755 Transcript_31567/m.63755 type:complete len:250 (-) Transcript_31567:2884-3633(-)